MSEAPIARLDASTVPAEAPAPLNAEAAAPLTIEHIPARAPVQPQTAPLPPASPQVEDSSAASATHIDEHLRPHRRWQRALEIVPGLVTWTLILAPIVLSFRFPEIVAWFVLSFDFYWFYKNPKWSFNANTSVLFPNSLK